MENNKICLVSNILVSDEHEGFNKNKIIKKYTILQDKETSFLALKENKKTFTLLEDHVDIKENENIIFRVDVLRDKITLTNKVIYCKNCKNKNQFYQGINKLNFKLWKALPLYKDNDNDKYNIQNYFYELKENDIIRLGNVKLILREIHINNNDKNNNNNKDIIKRPFTLRLKCDKTSICNECGQNYTSPENPLINLECTKYYHYKCIKDKIKNKIKKDEYENGCIRYYFKTNCLDCKKFSPLSFIVEFDEVINKNNEKIKFFELIDIPRDENEDYLVFETIDFWDKQKEYIKYIYFIKLNNLKNVNSKDKHVEIILLGGEEKKSNNKYNIKYNKLIKIEGNSTVSFQHAIIEYDLENKTLKLSNKSEKHNTLVLQDKLELKYNDKYNEKLLFELGNIQIESYLIKKEQIDEIKTKMKDNPDEIEYRKKNSH